MHQDPTFVFEQMPDFQSHEEARTWFKSKFGDQFLLKMTDITDGKRIFYYHLVKDPVVYEDYMEALAHPEGANITSTEPFHSYSTIEITEDGDISFSI